MSDIQPADNLPIAHLGPLTAAGTSTWEAITELATLVPVERWAIVGGQMVAIHAALAGVEPPRVTDDGDVVVDVRVFGRQAMRDVASTLTSIDFKSSESPEGVTRFERGNAKIDLLAPEGIGANAETIRGATIPIFDDLTHRARLTVPNIDDVVDVASLLLD